MVGLEAAEHTQRVALEEYAEDMENELEELNDSEVRTSPNSHPGLTLTSPKPHPNLTQITT